MADSTFADIVDRTHAMAVDMEKTNNSAASIAVSFKQLLSVWGAGKVVDQVVAMVKQSEIGLRIQKSFKQENLDIEALNIRQIALLDKKFLIERNIRLGINADDQRAKLVKVDRALELLKNRITLADKFNGLGKEGLVLSGLALGAATELWAKQREFNQNLIEANSTYDHRNRLIQETLMTQTQLGISFDKVTDAARALVHYGMDVETSFDANLRLVAQMEQGLGVSVNESARLASVVERQVLGSFEGVARTIAQIVEGTSLAGDEAARLATNISTALGRLRPGLGAAGLPEVVKLVGRYEGALKEVGGQAGAFQQFITQMTTPEGILGAGTLGVNPEFLATAQGVQNVMTRFADYGKMLVGQSQGWDRQMRLQALAQQFNLTSDQANQMLIAIKRANAQQGEQLSLQDRWKNQLNATNSGISRLTNSFWGLLQNALLPVVNIVGMLANKLADLVETLFKAREVVTVLGAGLLIGFGLLAFKLYGVARALMATALSSTVAQAALSRYAALRGVSGVTGGVASGFGLSLFQRSLLIAARGIGIALSPAGLLVATLVGVGYFAHKQWSELKRLREENTQAQQIILSKQDALEANRQARIYTAARYGTSEDVMAVVKRLMSDANSLFSELNPRERRAAQQEWLNKQMSILPTAIAKGVMTRGMFQTVSERSPEDVKREAEMGTPLEAKILKANEAQTVLLDKRMKQAQETAREEEQQRTVARALSWNPFGAFQDWVYDRLR